MTGDRRDVGRLVLELAPIDDGIRVSCGLPDVRLAAGEVLVELPITVAVLDMPSYEHAAASSPGRLLEITVRRVGVSSTHQVAVGADTVLVPAWPSHAFGLSSR